MEQETYILAVDDHALNRENLQEIIEDAETCYHIRCVESGPACLAAINEQNPDIILLDVNMPGMSGRDTCRAIRDIPSMQNTPIIFISSLATEDERLKGYQAGGNDYLTRPFKNGELISKIEFHIKHIKDKESLENSSKDSMTLANIAWDTSYELGQVLSFIKSTFNCHSHSDLSLKLFEFLGALGLRGSIMLKRNSGYQFFFSDCKARDIEKNLLKKVHHYPERIVEYKHRRIFNAKHAILLIRNMEFDEETLGRYRDHFAILIEGIDARVNALNDELALRKKQRVIDTMEVVHENIKNIDLQHQNQRVKNSQIISQLITNVEDAFVHLGLDENQEEYLLSLVQKVERETDALYQAGYQLNREFESLMTNLSTVVGKESRSEGFQIG